MGDAGFVEMAEVVKLVAEDWVGEPALAVDPFVSGGIGMHGAEGIEITIGLLGRGDGADIFIEPGLEGWIFLETERKGSAFHGFVHIRIVERIKGGWLVLKVGLAGGAAVHGFGGELE